MHCPRCVERGRRDGTVWGNVLSRGNLPASKTARAASAEHSRSIAARETRAVRPRGQPPARGDHRGGPSAPSRSAVCPRRGGRAFPAPGRLRHDLVAASSSSSKLSLSSPLFQLPRIRYTVLSAEPAGDLPTPARQQADALALLAEMVPVQLVLPARVRHRHLAVPLDVPVFPPVRPDPELQVPAPVERHPVMRALHGAVSFRRLD